MGKWIYSVIFYSNPLRYDETMYSGNRYLYKANGTDEMYNKLSLFLLFPDGGDSFLRLHV